MKYLILLFLFPTLANATTYNYTVLNEGSGFNIHGDRTYSESLTNADIPGMTVTCEDGHCTFDVGGTSDQLSFHVTGDVLSAYDTTTGAFYESHATDVSLTWEGVQYASDSGRLYMHDDGATVGAEGYFFHANVPEGLLQLCLAQTLHFDGPASRIASNPEPASLLLLLSGLSLLTFAFPRSETRGHDC